jgi:hypothetical protein
MDNPEKLATFGTKDTGRRWNRRCRDRMVVGFTTTYAISE